MLPHVYIFIISRRLAVLLIIIYRMVGSPYPVKKQAPRWRREAC